MKGIPLFHKNVAILKRQGTHELCELKRKQDIYTVSSSSSYRKDNTKFSKCMHAFVDFYDRAWTKDGESGKIIIVVVHKMALL